MSIYYGDQEVKVVQFVLLKTTSQFVYKLVLKMHRPKWSQMFKSIDYMSG